MSQIVFDFGHVFLGIIAMAIGVVLWNAANSFELRVKLGPDERYHAFNSRMLGVFHISCGLEFASATAGVTSDWHAAALGLSIMAGLIVCGSFGVRILQWKK